MSGQFTPGPWQAHSDYTLEGQTTVIGNVDGEYIDGTLHTTFDFVCDTLGDDDSRSATVARANACLIAAAPDLLEALRLMIADFADYPASKRPCLAFDKARAAIAKAIPPAPAPKAATASLVVDSNSGIEGAVPEKGSLT